MVSNGAIVVCAGGGGIPVVRNKLGRLEDAVAILAGTAETTLTPTGDYSPPEMSARQHSPCPP